MVTCISGPSARYSCMSATLPDPSGPFKISCVDVVWSGKDGEENGPRSPFLVRLYMPTSNPNHPGIPYWLPDIQYTFGYLAFVAEAKTLFTKALCWVLAGIAHSLMRGVQLRATMGAPLLDTDTCRSYAHQFYAGGMEGLTQVATQDARMADGRAAHAGISEADVTAEFRGESAALAAGDSTALAGTGSPHAPGSSSGGGGPASDHAGDANAGVGIGGVDVGGGGEDRDDVVILPDGRLPVVVFSHGLGAMRCAYSHWISEMASRGYVVAAVEHRDGSACTSAEFPLTAPRGGDAPTGGDGSTGARIRTTAEEPSGYTAYKFVPGTTRSMSAEERNARHQAHRCSQLKRRAAELRHVVNLLELLNGEEGRETEERGGGGRSPLDIVPPPRVVGHPGTQFDLATLRGRMDLNKLAVVGHSFGAMSALKAGAEDARFKVVVGGDVWFFPASEDFYGTLMPKPLCLVHTERFHWHENAVSLRRVLHARREALPANVTHYVRIKGAAHQNQCDFPLLMTGLMRKIRMAGDIDPLHCSLVNSYVGLRFLSVHLLGRDTMTLRRRLSPTDFTSDKEVDADGLAAEEDTGLEPRQLSSTPGTRLSFEEPTPP
eukprot:jgi/Mesvir1/14758/Mv05400-RA.1